MARRPRLHVRPLEARTAPAAGGLDPTFGSAGIASIPFPGSTAGTDAAYAVALAPDGRVVAAGQANNHHGLVRLTADGQPDPTFGGAGRVAVAFDAAGAAARAVAVLPDGRVVAAGWVTTTDHGTDMTVLRLNPDGTSDPSFDGDGRKVITLPDLVTPDQGSYPADERATAVRVQPDGKILLAGAYTHRVADEFLSNRVEFAVVRLNPDGTFDPSFGGTGVVLLDFAPALGAPADAGGDVADLGLLPDGRVVVGGYLTGPAGTAPVVARLTPAGQPDASFDGDGLKAVAAPAAQRQTEAVEVLADGRVLVGGWGSGMEVVRLGADGQLDPTFGGAGVWAGRFTTGAEYLFDLAAQPDGKVLVFGEVTEDLGIGNYRTSAAVARLNPDGTPDATFGEGGLARFPVGAIARAEAGAVQPDGRIVFAGYGVSNGSPAFAVARAQGVTLPNTPPTVSDIPDRTVSNQEPTAIPFTVGDRDTPAGELTVTAASSDPGVFPADSLFVDGSGADRRIVLTPRFDRVGTATITVRVADTDGGVAEESFRVTVSEPVPAIPGGPRIPAGEFHWFQATPDGTLAQLVWAEGTLVYRTRANAGWTEEGVVQVLHTDGPARSRDEVQRLTQTAQLLFTPDGTPHAFVARFGPDPAGGDRSAGVIDHYRRAGGRWERADRIVLSRGEGATSAHDLTGAVGPGGVFHLLAAEDGRGRESGRLVYATNKGGTWAVQEIDRVNVWDDVRFYGARYAPRFLSIAADSQNNAHVAYTSEFQNLIPVLGVISHLEYATNRGGSWQTQTVYSPPDGSGDAGTGASIAVGPGDQVAIANYFTDRVLTGSPASGQLLYHSRRADGGWDTSTVAAAPDGYAGNDGPRFTGFSPHLVFRGGTPVITFSDVAGSHLPRTNANEMSGQIRTATLTPGGWALQTVYRQGNPLTEQVFFPVMVEFQGQPVFAALRAVNRVDGAGELTGWEAFELIELNAPAVAPRGPRPGTAGGAAGAGVVGAGAGGGPVVQVYDRAGALRFETAAFEESFTGGVRVASADFNRDGVPDVVVGTGPGRATRVRVLDGKDQRELFAVDPFEAAFTGGVYVAAGDLDGDGVPELVVTPDEGGGPRVRVFSGKGFGQVADFFGIDDPNFRGGARAAVGDVSGDKVGDLVVAAGFMGGPRVAGFDGRSLAGGSPVRVFGDFYAFEQTLRNGVFVTVGDLDGDGFAELIAGGGPGGGPRVTAFSGKALRENRHEPAANFFAGDPNNRGGVRLAVLDLDGDARADLLTGAGAGAGSRVTAYLGNTLGAGDPAAARDFEAFPGFAGGVFVG